MDVIEIGPTQLVFVLDKGDMTKYSICANESSPFLREGFRRLVSDLGLNRNFSGGVLVQIFESKSGGCEMFVTKLPDSIGILNGTNETDRAYIYIFQSLTDLLSGCYMLACNGITGGYAYAEAKAKNYYLILDNECKYLGEFGATRCKNSAREYLQEHCTLISSRAIEQLSALA